MRGKDYQRSDVLKKKDCRSLWQESYFHFYWRESRGDTYVAYEGI